MKKSLLKAIITAEQTKNLRPPCNEQNITKLPACKSVGTGLRHVHFIVSFPKLVA